MAGILKSSDTVNIRLITIHKTQIAAGPHDINNREIWRLFLPAKPSAIDTNQFVLFH